MSAAFTPGPWSVGPPHVVAQRSVDGKGRRTTRFVAEAVLSSPIVEGEQEANARLIAAAPDLYYAVYDLLSYLLPRPDTAAAISVTPTPDYSIAKARAALAKARGDQ